MSKHAAALVLLSSLFGCADDASSSSGGTGGNSGGGGNSGSSGGPGTGGDPFDINECETGQAECAPNATCVDTPGFYQCVCNAGFEGDGVTCSNVDECLNLTDDCDDNALCTDSEGSFSCECAAGFEGDGRSCEARYLHVATGQSHVCAVRTDNTLQCFGLNSSGQLGFGTNDPIFLRPVQAGSAANYASVSAGNAFTCAITLDGAGVCFGANTNGQLGDGTTATKTSPAFISESGSFLQLDAGSSHACGILTGGALKCWGKNDRGQLGINSQVDQTTPQAVQTGQTWKSVSAGADFSCGVRTNGTLFCWGLGTSRQLGTGEAVSSLVPLQESTQATDWQSVQTGVTFACGLKTDGTRHCWGANSLGQGGSGTLTTLTTPTLVGSETDWQTLALGESTGCGVRSGGGLRCWGDGSLGQTGGTAELHPTPVDVESARSFTEVATSLRTSCAIDSEQRLYCWGTASRGISGQGFNADRTAPDAVAPAESYASLDVQLEHSCALRTSGQLECWGRNAFGQLGDGSAISRSAPTLVEGSDWTLVQTGRAHSCGLRKPGAVGEVWCWGSDSLGELGNGAAAASLVPVAVPLPNEDVKSLAVGLNHACALTADKELYCWGRNDLGQLGDNTNTNRPSPVRVDPTGNANFESVVSNGQFTCALRGAQGALHCWGSNSVGQLGLGDAAPIETDEPALVGTGFSQVGVSSNHTCALKAGELYCWGRNASGELGLGATTPSSISIPTKIGAKNDWQSVTLGQGASTFVQDATGAFFTFGSNGNGQLANGTTSTVTSPQQVLQGLSFEQLSLGGEHACGIVAGGQLSCWGSAAYAQLGSGVPFSSVPQLVVNPL